MFTFPANRAWKKKTFYVLQLNDDNTFQMYPANVSKKEPAVEFRQCNCLFLLLSQWYIYFNFVVIVDFRFCFNISSYSKR